MIVHPEIHTTPDRPIVRFRDVPDGFELDKALHNILKREGWGVGVIFTVQFISHNRTHLMKSADFIVTFAEENLVTNDGNPYQPVTKAVQQYAAERLTKWFAPAKDKEAPESDKAAESTSWKTPDPDKASEQETKAAKPARKAAGK